jgi:hypothetical protein
MSSFTGESKESVSDAPAGFQETGRPKAVGLRTRGGDGSEVRDD